jgi:hypothetical protein
MLVNTTAALGIMLPEESDTEPEICPVRPCAAREATKMSRQRRPSTIRIAENPG